MKIVVATADVAGPEEPAGALGNALVAELRRLGHEVEIVEVPFSRDPETIAEQLVGCRLTRVDDCDLVIALRPPAHLLRHSRKVLWLETADWGMEGRADRVTGAADGLAIAEATRAYAASTAVAGQVLSACGRRLDLLDPPASEPHNGSWEVVARQLIP